VSLAAVPRSPVGLPRCQGLLSLAWTSPQGEAAGFGDKGFLVLTGCQNFGDKAFRQSRGCWELRSLCFLLRARTCCCSRVNMRNVPPDDVLGPPSPSPVDDSDCEDAIARLPARKGGWRMAVVTEART
jgi:hypothetical protein